MTTSIWIALASLVVSVGGLTVGIIGYRSNAGAIRREQADRTDQIDAHWASEWAAQRPVVFPSVDPTWATNDPEGTYPIGSRLLPIKNGGRGPALNVKGEMSVKLDRRRSRSIRIGAGPIAAGDQLDARLSGSIDGWVQITGVLEYEDLVNQHYETVFEFSRSDDGEPTVLVQVRDDKAAE